MKRIQVLMSLAVAGLFLSLVTALMVAERRALQSKPRTALVSANERPSRATPLLTETGEVPVLEVETMRVAGGQTKPERAALLNATNSSKATLKTTTVNEKAGRAAKQPIQDPVARMALAFVGADPFAEAYWYFAINDPTLSAEERQDLIEDLNEDGLSDPKRPTLQDLPLILNRLQLIEELAPEAMDKGNLDAFLEAYKDLLNLAEVATGGGQPVR